jgi:hypothetical protein
MPDTDTDRIDEQELVIDGNVLTVDDLTFREQREMRAAIRDALEDPEASLEDAPIAEFYLALIYTVKKRDNPELTIDDALDWKLKDFLRPVEKGPTKAPRKR